MAKYLKIDEILEKTGNKQKVKKYMSEGMTYAQAYQKAYPMAKHHANHKTAESWESFLKEAGVASKIVGGIGKGLGKMFGYAKKHPVVSTAVGGLAGKVGYDIAQYNKDMKMVDNLKKKQLPNPDYSTSQVDSLVTDINSRYKGLAGSKSVETPYGQIYLPKEAFK